MKSWWEVWLIIGVWAGFMLAACSSPVEDFGAAEPREPPIRHERSTPSEWQELARYSGSGAVMDWTRIQLLKHGPTHTCLAIVSNGSAPAAVAEITCPNPGAPEAQ